MWIMSSLSPTMGRRVLQISRSRAWVALFAKVGGGPAWIRKQDEQRRSSTPATKPGRNISDGTVCGCLASRRQDVQQQRCSI